MAKISIEQFARELRITPEVLLKQFCAAGVNKRLIADDVTEKDKVQLLDYLRKFHEHEEEKGRIILFRPSDGIGKVPIRVIVREKKRLVIAKKFGAQIVEIKVEALRVEEYLAKPIENGQCARCSRVASRERINTNQGILSLCPECTGKARSLSVKLIASKKPLPKIERPKKKRNSYFRFLQGGAPGLGKR